MVPVALWAPFTFLLSHSRALLSCAGIAVALHAGNIPAAIVFALACSGVHARSLHACRLASFWAAHCCVLSQSPWFRIAAGCIFLRFPIFGEAEDTLEEVDYSGDAETAPDDVGFLSGGDAEAALHDVGILSPPVPPVAHPAVVFWNWPDKARWEQQNVVQHAVEDVKCMWLKVETATSKGHGIRVMVVLHDAALQEPLATRIENGHARTTAMSCTVLDGCLSSDRRAPTLLTELPVEESFRSLLSAASRAGARQEELWPRKARSRETRDALESVNALLSKFNPLTVFDLGSGPLLNIAGMLASPGRTAPVMMSLQNLPDVSLWCTIPPPVRFTALKLGLGRESQTTPTAVLVLSAYLKTSFWAKLCSGVNSAARLVRFLPGSPKAKTDSLFFDQPASQLKNAMLFIVSTDALRDVLNDDLDDEAELASKIWNAGRMVRVCSTTMSEARIAPKRSAVSTSGSSASSAARGPAARTEPYVALELLDCHEFVFAYMVLRKTAH